MSSRLHIFVLIVRRFLECPKVHKSLVNVLGHLSYLYKFHQKPITFLYNTLHYFERRIRDNPFLKKKLIYSITGALKVKRCMVKLKILVVKRNIDDL